jgi:hypothetical protein
VLALGGVTPVHSRRLLIAGLITVAALAAPTAAMAAAPLSVVVVTGSQCVFGTAPKNNEVVATLKTPGGHLRGRVITASDQFGDWSACFSGPINGGDSLRVVAGTKDRTIVVPRVEPQIDRVANVIEGSAPPNSLVLAEVVHLKTLKKTSTFQFDTMSNGSGHYSFDTTGTVNLRGNDAVTIFTQRGNDIFGAFVIAPFVSVQDANNLVVGNANNGTHLTLELRNSHGGLKANVTAGGLPLFFGISLFQVALYDDDGSAAYPIAGDVQTATLASDAVLTMPNSSLNGDADTDIVTGRCMPNVNFSLAAGFEFFYGKTDATGHFTRDVSSKTNLHRGDRVALTCLYPSGDTWARETVAQ